MLRYLNALAVAGLLLSSCGPNTTSDKEAPKETELKAKAPAIAYSFVTVGCNRISWSDDGKAWKASPYYNEAHANLTQLNATFDDVLKLEHTPDYFFFTGDLVLAENPDKNVLIDQLKGWKKLYAEHAISKSAVKMVAIPGNHEFLYSEAPDYNEVPNEHAHKIWLELMGDFIAGSNGPGKGGPDSLIYDESKLTYSIDHKGDHFVMMNTDTYDQPGKVPAHWIVNDLHSFRSAHPKGHIFLFGHKPAYDAGGAATGDASDPGFAYNQAQLDAIWDAMDTTRSEAMFSAHEHLFWAGVPAGHKSWQIIAGNGGTTLETGDFFGFTEVQVMTDGTVKAISHGRPVPKPDYGALKGTTTPRDTFDITWSGK